MSRGHCGRTRPVGARPSPAGPLVPSMPPPADAGRRGRGCGMTRSRSYVRHRRRTPCLFRRNGPKPRDGGRTEPDRLAVPEPKPTSDPARRRGRNPADGTLGSLVRRLSVLARNRLPTVGGGAPRPDIGGRRPRPSLGGGVPGAWPKRSNQDPRRPRTEDAHARNPVSDCSEPDEPMPRPNRERRPDARRLDRNRRTEDPEAERPGAPAGAALGANGTTRPEARRIRSQSTVCLPARRAGLWCRYCVFSLWRSARPMLRPASYRRWHFSLPTPKRRRRPTRLSARSPESRTGVWNRRRPFGSSAKAAKRSG